MLVTIRSFATQLAVRLAMIGALLSTAGVISYSATHWNPPTSGAESSNSAPAGH